MLTNSQKKFFAAHGYLVLRGVIDRDVCGHFIDVTWSQLPESWRRDDPETWTGDVIDSCHTASLIRRRGHIKFQKGPLLNDPLAAAAFGASSKLGQIASSIIGKQVMTRYRGLYLIAPIPDAIRHRKFQVPHVEAHPVQIVATTYLEDVRLGGGGLLVWPGSHLSLYHAFESKLDFVQKPGYARLCRYYDQLVPVELTGEAGDVVLIHYRLFHAPSLNSSRSIRFAMFSDYLVPSFRELVGQAPSHEIWEDWPPMAKIFGPLAVRPHAYVRQDPKDRVASTQLPPSTPSTTNKADASRLVRSFRPNEVWIAVSESSKLKGSSRVEPCGENERLRAMVVNRDRIPLMAETRFDFISRVLSGNDQSSSVVLSIPSPPVDVNVRVVRIGQPMSESHLLYEGAMFARDRGQEIVVTHFGADRVN